MINIGQNYNLVADLLSKNNGVFISPEEYDRYAKIASDSLFDSYIGADTLTKVSYGKNRTLDDRLRPFRETLTLPVVSGVVDFPEDYAKVTKVHTVDFIPIRPLDEDRLAKGHQDPYTSPDESERFYEETSTGINIYPDDISTVVFSYLKRPVSPKYGYTLNERGRAIYDESTSVHFEWDKRQENDLTMRILQLCGVSMKDIAKIQFTQAKQNEE